MSAPSRVRPLLLCALLLSGMAGLAHEVAWARLLSNLIGSTATAQAVVLSVFMGGLALGAVIFGRASDRRGDPLRTYIRLELGIALYCALLPLVVRLAGAGYESIAASLFESPGAKLSARVVLAVLSVLLPALWMGGTLPIAARALIHDIGQTRKEVASVYAYNNIGAVFGTGLCGFWLLPTFGIQITLICASLLNLSAAALAGAARKRRIAAEPDAAPAPVASEPQYGAATFRLTLIALFLSGFAAMGYEVLFVRTIALGLGSSTYSFTLMLMAFIAGIGLGSFVLSLRQVRRPLWWLAASQLAVVASLVFVAPLLERLPYWTGLLRVSFQAAPDGFRLYLAGQGLIVLLVLMLPTVCLGFGFPLVAQIQARSPASIGATVGSTYAWNTVGNVLGVVGTSLFLLPQLGMAQSYSALVCTHLVGGLILVGLAREARAVPRLAAALIAIACAVLVSSYSSWAWTLNHATGHLRLREGPPPGAPPQMRASWPTESFAAWKRNFVVDPQAWDEIYLAEDPDATVLVLQQDKIVQLFVNGKGDASTGPLDMITFEMIGHVPMFLAPHARSMLVIGHGSGVTTASAMRHPLQQIDLVEISQGVLDADRLFAEFNYGVLADPRLTVYRDDARTFLRTVPRKYDIIVSQPSNPWIAGIGGLFTVDFFQDAAARLNPGGVFAMWFHQYEQSDETVELVVRTLHQVFPHVEVFFSYLDEVMAFASFQPIAPDFAAMEERFDLPDVRHDLARVSIHNLANLLGFQAISSARFPRSFGPGPLNTDDHQRLEYLGAKNMFLGQNSEHLSRFDGFQRAPDGTTDSLLDRYLAWRAAQGAPASRPELEDAARSINFILKRDGRESRVADTIAARMSSAAADAPAPDRPARGALPDPQSLTFSEAYNRGIVRSNAGRTDEAILLWKRALELEPGHPLATQALCDVYVQHQNGPEALALAEESMRRRPRDVAAALYMARVALMLQDRAAARRGIDAALAQGENAEALYMLGALAYSEGNRAEALRLSERALALDPACWQASMALVTLLVETKDQTNINRAGKVLWDALQLDPENPQLIQMRRELTGS